MCFTMYITPPLVLLVRSFSLCRIRSKPRNSLGKPTPYAQPLRTFLNQLLKHINAFYHLSGGIELL